MFRVSEGSRSRQEPAEVFLGPDDLLVIRKLTEDNIITSHHDD